MTLTDWLSYLEQPRQIKPGVERLTRVRSIADALGLLPLAYKVISVTGTNGKGSTVASCSHILQAGNYRVGSYTSPHLIRYNERIAIQNQAVSDQALCQAFQAIEAARGQIELSYFEYSFLAALYLFHQADIDLAVLEIGIGGRLDAVNAIDADVAVITTVDFDHMQFLGNSREAIAYEKAGIFRAGCPAIYGDRDLPEAVQTEADKLKAPLYVLGRDYDFSQYTAEWAWRGPEQHYAHLPFPPLYLPNAATALMALTCLNVPLKHSEIKQGIQNIHLPGRQQLIEGPCHILLDVAHNPQAARLLAERIEKLPRPGRVYAIFSALADKDLPGVVAPFKNTFTHWYYAPLASARTASKSQLQAVLPEHSSSGCDSILEALQIVLRKVDAHDWLIVFGSFYTVAEVARKLEDHR